MNAEEERVFTLDESRRAVEEAKMGWLTVPSRNHVRAARTDERSRPICFLKKYEPIVALQTIVLANIMHDLGYDWVEIVSLKDGQAVLRGHSRRERKR